MNYVPETVDGSKGRITGLGLCQSAKAKWRSLIYSISLLFEYIDLLRKDTNAFVTVFEPRRQICQESEICSKSIQNANSSSIRDFSDLIRDNFKKKSGTQSTSGTFPPRKNKLRVISKMDQKATLFPGTLQKVTGCLVAYLKLLNSLSSD
jgi:hypothetical protein